MSTDELMTGPARDTRVRDDRPRTPWWRRPWIVPLAAVAVLFVVYALPPYLGLDPAEARLQPQPDHAAYYPLLVTHIFLGSVALLTACLQVWPWLRRTHPAVHRWTGRVYVAACLPASLCVMVVAPMSLSGPTAQVANTMLAVLWFLTTLAGYRAVRQRRFGAHREWMLRSFALTFSIVVNRVWLVIMFAAFAPGLMSGAEVDPADLQQAVGAASWCSWVVNLLLVEWWLHRRSRSSRQARQAPPVRSGSTNRWGSAGQVGLRG